MKDSNFLIKKLSNKAEFVDGCTWVLGSENGRNAFASCNSIGDFKKALSAGYSCYYISPDVFSGDFKFENVFFEGRPNGLSVDVEFRLQLFPETLGFADWVKENVSFELSKEAFVEKIRAPKYGLKDFLQEWFVFAHDDKLDFGLLQKYGKGALREYVGQSRYIDPWLHIDGMQWIKVDDIPARERESLEKFNEIQRKHADELRALREKTAFEVSKISIEEALAIAQSNQRLAEVSRQLEIKRLESDIAKANAEKAEAELRELQAKKAKEGLTNQQSERLISLQEGITQYYKELKWRDSRIEELESLIDSLTRELTELRKKFSDKDWYDELSAWGKVLRHVRSITAMLFYIAGFYCILAGCKYSKLDASGKVLFSHLSSIGQWFAFVEAAIFWLTAFILNGQTVKKSFNEIKYWWIELFKGKIKVNLPLLVCGFLRIFAASYLMVIGAFAVIWIPYLFIWGFLYEFQKEFFTGVIVICMAASGLGLGSYTLGARLLMKRRIRATSKSGRKWVMIIFIPLLFIAFYDERAARRVDNLEVKISEMFLSKKERDIRKAIKAYDNKDYATWWTLVANLDQGDRRIVGRLGHSYFLGLGIKRPDYRKAVEQFEKLLEKVGSDGEGYASVEYLIGLCYHRLSEYNTAIGYFKNAIGDGDFDALLYAGQYYEFGLGGCELDLKEAAKYFERALKSKNEKVREKAEEYLKRVRSKIDQLDKLRSSLGFDNQFKCDVLQGEDKRLFKRKVAREESELKKSTEAAIQAYNQKKYVEFWNLLKEADKEDVRIIVRMGDAYMRGYGVKIDLMGAIKEYEKIRNVKVGAQRAFFEWQIAACYHDLFNYNKSAEYARFAINNGCSEAWILIGSYTEQGLAGYTINLEEAKGCYEKAVTSSNAIIKKTAKDGIERVMAKIKAKQFLELASRSARIKANQEEEKIEFTTHIVQRGDTLSKISQRYDIKVDDIVANNPHIKNYVVHLGQKIKLPSKVNVGRQVVASARKEIAELVKEAHNAFVAKDWKTGFDIATNLTMTSILDPYVTSSVGLCYLPNDYLPKFFERTAYPVKKNFSEAYKWLKRTVELNSTYLGGSIQFMLGDIELVGRGCEVNKEKAIEWFKRSADQNFYDACFKLGEYYEEGLSNEGMKSHLVSATNWYYKALSVCDRCDEILKAYEAYKRVVERIKIRGKFNEL